MSTTMKMVGKLVTMYVAGLILGKIIDKPVSKLWGLDED